MMAQISQPVLATTTTDVFENGNIHWKQINVDPSTTPSCPKPLLVFTPTVPGAYPVILFYHGFYLRNSFYSMLFGHIVSHGFILVAPQLFSNGLPMRGQDEVEYAGKVVDWIADGLKSLLPENVKAESENKLVLAGHSKGGKTAFAVALGYAKTKLKYSALIGIDPVAGLTKMFRTYPHILTNVPQSFKLDIPIAVIGTGLGPEKANFFSLPCAADGVNHKEFFNECKPPCVHFVVKDYGHMDMLDDSTPGITFKCLCKSGTDKDKTKEEKDKHRDLMRRTVGGLVVAFLRAYLNAQSMDLDAIVAKPDLAPAKIEDPVVL